MFFINELNYTEIKFHGDGFLLSTSKGKSMHTILFKGISWTRAHSAFQIKKTQNIIGNHTWFFLNVMQNVKNFPGVSILSQGRIDIVSAS